MEEAVVPKKKKSLRNVAVVLAVVAVAVALLLAALLLLLVLVNKGDDEPLREELRSFLEAKPMEMPDSENIYVAMFGFHAPEGEDIFEAGRRNIERKKRESEQKGLEAQEEPAGKEELLWQKVEPSFDCFMNKGTDFLKCAHSQKERLEKELAANETLVARYHRLQKLPRYVAPTFPYGAPSFLPQILQIIEVQKHLAAHALLEVEAGSTKGLAFFKEDMAFLRRILEGKKDNLWAAVALRMMAGNIDSLSLLLSSPSTELEEEASMWRELLAPLSREQLNMRPMVEEEIRLMYNTVVLLAETRGNAVFLPNTTMNYGAPLFNAWLRLSALPWKDYMEQREEASSLFRELLRPQPHWIYNPFGKWVFGKVFQLVVMEYSLDRGIRSLHELDAYLRMVRLQLALRQASILSDQVPAFIEQLDKASCAPCSDFSWDIETRMLSFQPFVRERWMYQPSDSPSVYVPEIRKEGL